jgi:hypothetical protein
MNPFNKFIDFKLLFLKIQYKTLNFKLLGEKQKKIIENPKIFAMFMRLIYNFFN